MFKKTKVAAAVATLVGASAASIGTAQAGVAFFPFLVNGPTITSIVSTMNMGIGPEKGPFDEALHYRLYYKPVTAAHEDGCKELNVWRPTSKYDINTIDLGGKFGETTLGVLFNDPSVSGYPASTGSFSFGKDLDPHRGYLLVDNADDAPVGGEMFILELTSGAAWGYQALLSDAEEAPDADFTGEVSASPSQVAIMPLNDMGDDIITKFTVTPIDTNMAPPQVSNYASQIQLFTDGAAVAYDRDELPVSAGIKKKVVCVGVVEASTLIDDGKAQLPDGGWSELVIDNPAKGGPPTTQPGWKGVDGAIVYKVEYGVDSFGGEPLQGPGIYNNGIRLQPAVGDTD